ncbi:MAG: hypothetical protein AAFP16_08410 [Pseudomonadota bacterium]
MDQSHQSFQDRIARLEKAHAHKRGAHDVAPPGEPPRPTAGGSGGGRPPRKGSGVNLIAVTIAVVFALVLTAGMITMLMVPPDRLYVALAEWKTERELQTPGEPESGNDLAFFLARKIVQRQLQDQDGTDPEKEAKLEAFLDRTENTSMVDVMRDNVRGVILFESSAEGYPAIGETAAAKLDRCKSTDCVALIRAKFQAELRQAKSGS